MKCNFFFVWKDFIAKDQQKAKNNKYKIIKVCKEISQLTKQNRNKRRKKTSPEPNLISPSPDKSTQKIRPLAHTHFHTAVTTTN